MTSKLGLKERIYLYLGDSSGFIRIWELTEIINTIESVSDFCSKVNMYMAERR